MLLVLYVFFVPMLMINVSNFASRQILFAYNCSSQFSWALCVSLIVIQYCITQTCRSRFLLLFHVVTSQFYKNDIAIIYNAQVFSQIAAKCYTLSGSDKKHQIYIFGDQKIKLHCRRQIKCQYFTWYLSLHISSQWV